VNYKVKSTKGSQKIYINLMEKDTYIYGAGHYGVLTALDLEQKAVKNSILALWKKIPTFTVPGIMAF